MVFRHDWRVMVFAAVFSALSFVIAAPRLISIAHAQTTTPSNGQSNYFEFNLNRADANAGAAKLLNNLYNDYTVTCMPKQELSLLFKGTNAKQFDETRCTMPTNQTDPNNKIISVSCAPTDWYKDWNIAASLTFDAKGKLFGLFRNEQAVNQRIADGNKPITNRMESIEAYMSARNEFPVNPAGGDLNSENASTTLRLTLPQQCIAARNKLLAVQKLCAAANRIEGDTTKCAIDGPVPGTNYTSHLALLAAFGNSDCETLMNGNSQLKDDMLKVSPAMETAYRPAFVVAITDFDGDPNLAVNQGKNVVFYPEDGRKERLATVDFLEIKVPAFASDFLDNDTSDKAYRDPAVLIADSLHQIDVQETVREEEKSNRDKIRQLGGDRILIDFTVPGETTPRKTYCYSPGNINERSLVPCDTNVAGQGYLPGALMTFINASVKAQPSLSASAKQDLSCEPIKNLLYGTAEATAIKDAVLTTEQTRQSIGSSLDSRDIGNLQKKKTVTLGMKLNIPDLRKVNPETNIDSHTRLYFVSPHYYNLKYVQESWMSFLTLEQQKKLADISASNQTSAVDPKQFSPYLRTSLEKNLSGTSQDKNVLQTVKREVHTFVDKIICLRYKTITQTIQIPFLGPYIQTIVTDQCEPGYEQTIKEERIEFPTDTTNTTINASLTPSEPANNNQLALYWNFAGQVANLPTRMLSLVKTTLDHPLNIYTQSCKGDYATEDWLLGQCPGASGSPGGTQGTSSQ